MSVMSAQPVLEMEVPLSEHVRANVRAEAARRGFNQTQLASMLGMPRGAVNQRYRGLVPWTLDETQKAAHALRVPLSDLLLPHLDSNQEPSDKRTEGAVIEIESWRERGTTAA